MVRAKNMVLSFLNKFRFEPRIYEYEDENGEIVALDISQWRIRVWRSVLKEYADYAGAIMMLIIKFVSFHLKIMN